jgi:hypothetical protein
MVVSGESALASLVETARAIERERMCRYRQTAEKRLVRPLDEHGIVTHGTSLQVREDNSARRLMDILPQPKASAMNFSNRAFDVDYHLERDGMSVGVSGTIVNLLEREVGTALLSFHFYDADDVRINQEQLFINEIEPREKVRFTGAIVLGAGEIQTVRLVKAEPIPPSDFPELQEGAAEAEL